MTSPAFGQTSNTRARPDPMVLAKQHSDRHDAARRLLDKQLDAAGVLFGQPIREVLYRTFEDMVENHGEMLYHYTDEINAKQARIDELQVLRGQERVDNAALRSHTRRCANELKARYERSNRAQPDWLIDALQAAGPGPIALAEEPF